MSRTCARHAPRSSAFTAVIATLAVTALSVVSTMLMTTPVAAAVAMPQAPLTANFNAESNAEFTGGATSANARFVVAGYQQLLGREADTAGLDFHVSRLSAGGDRTRQAFAYSMLFSVEGSRQEVRRAYQGLLSRPADTVGEDYWTSHLQGHGVLDLRVLLMSSEEYYRHSGDSDLAWLEALYLDVLGRGSDETGRQYWLSVIESGVPRQLVVAGLYLSDEALGRRVDAYFQESLSRAPTASERVAAIDTIRADGERGLRAEIWASDEAYEQYLDAALS